MSLIFRSLALLISLSYLQAQILSVSGPSSVRPGQTIVVTINSTVQGAAGLQWSGNFPWTPTSIAAATVLTGAQKTLYCNTSYSICLAVGINTNLMGQGVIATYSIQVPSNELAGVKQISLSNTIAASLIGVEIPTTAGTVLNVTVLDKHDLNNDSAVNKADVDIAIDQATGRSACNIADLNGDGRCGLIDILMIIRKIVE